MRDGFSAIQCSEKPEREKVSGEVCDKLCLGVKWSVVVCGSEMTAVSLSKLHGQKTACLTVLLNICSIVGHSDFLFSAINMTF